MKILINWLISGIAVVVSSYLLPGVHVADFFVALVVALVLGIINAILRPVLIILTLPINLITFGLFIFVINALLVMLTTALVPGFTVDNFGWALLFSLVLSLITWFFHTLSR